MPYYCCCNAIYKCFYANVFTILFKIIFLGIEFWNFEWNTLEKLYGFLQKLCICILKWFSYCTIFTWSVVNEYHWLNEHEFIDAVAVAMITPGPVCNNSRFLHRLFSSRFPRSICCRIDNIFTLLFIYNFTCTFYAFLYNKKDEYKNKPYFSKTFILYSVNHFYQIYIPFTSFDQPGWSACYYDTISSYN